MRRFFIHRARTGGRTHRRLSFGMALFFELLRDWKKPGTDSVKGRLLLVSVRLVWTQLGELILARGLPESEALQVLEDCRSFLRESLKGEDSK